MKKTNFILIALFVLISSTSFAKSTDQRVTDLESRLDTVQKTYLTNNAEVASAVSRISTFDQEFASIKGSVEANSHLLEAQRQDLQRSIRALEHRLQSIEDRLEIFSKQINNAIGKVAPEVAREGELYQTALDKVQKSEYISAIADFQAFIKKYPRSEFVADAQYWIGECFFSTKDYRRAVKEFQVVVQKYPSHSKIPVVLLKQGSAFYELGMPDEAKIFFEKIMKEHPASTEAADARAKLDRINQKKAARVATPAPVASPVGAAPSKSPSAVVGTSSVDPAYTDLPSYPNETIEQQRAKLRQGSVTTPQSETSGKGNQSQQQTVKVREPVGDRF